MLVTYYPSQNEHNKNNNTKVNEMIILYGMVWYEMIILYTLLYLAISYECKKIHCRFIRAVSYRQFTRLIHGRLGEQRIALPACAYDAIGKKFPTDQHVGFQEE